MLNLEFVCDLESTAGYAAHARMMVRAFHQEKTRFVEAGIELRVVSRRKEESVAEVSPEEHDIYNEYLNKKNVGVDVRVFFEPAHFIRLTKGVKTVAFVQWEVTKIRDYEIKGDEFTNWVERMNVCDLIMTSSKSAKYAYEISGVRTPIVTNSGPVFKTNIELGQLPVAGLITDSKSGSFMDVKNRPVVIGYMAQWVPRKNIEAFIRDFTIAFNGNKNVVGLLKTYGSSKFSDDDTISKAAKIVRDSCKVVSPPDIFLVTEKLSDTQIEQFFNTIDIYYCPSRGEGFNVPAAMAAAAGVPVIAGSYGGHADFLTPDSLLPGSFSPCLGMSMYDSNQFWFNVDEMNAIADLRYISQQCYEARLGSTEAYDLWQNKTKKTVETVFSAAGVESFVTRFISQIQELCKQTTMV